MTLYGVVTMDIIGSRSVQERGKLQDKILDYIEQINVKCSDILAAPVSITLGDEWQLITSKPSSSYDLIHEFQQLFWKDEIGFYAGIGIGEISTICYNDIRKMDGPCFHSAREAINIAKKRIKGGSNYICSKQNKVYLKPSNELAHIQGSYSLKEDGSNFKPSHLEEIAVTYSPQNNAISGLYKTLTLENVINTIIENNEILKSKMTEKQKKVYIDYLKYGTYRNMIKNGDYYSESIGGISQKLNNAEFFTIQRNHKMIASLIDYYCMLREVRN